MNIKTTRFLILIIGALMFLPFLGQAPLFDWDEINFAESAREMIVSGNYARVQINFQPFWEKPPLFFWMQALSMHVFGVGEYAARFPNAIFGMITLLTVFEIGRRNRSNQFGLVWAICLAASFLPHVYFKSGIIDPVFNYFIFLAVYFMYLTVEQKPIPKYVVLSGLFAGLAVLTKGPVGLLIPLLVMGLYILFNRFRYFPSFKIILTWLMVVVATSLLWFGPEIWKNGLWFLDEFIRYQIRLFSTPDAGHGQPFYYHFVVVLLGCFPMSAFALAHFIRSRRYTDTPDRFRLWMKLLFWTVMVLFSLVTTKIVHYSSLAYLPLAYVGATEITRLLDEKEYIIPYWYRIMLLLIGLFIGIALFLLPWIGANTESVIPYIQDAFARQNMEADVSWPWYTFLPGLFWLTGLIMWGLWLQFSKIKLAVFSIFIGVLFATSTFLIFIPVRIAGYTQDAPVEFFKSLRNRDVYFETLGYKSYAQYYYGEKKALSPLEEEQGKDSNGVYHIDRLRDWLLTGVVDKPVYFVTKTIYEKEYTDAYQLDCIGRKNGFSLLYRPLQPKH